MLRAARIYQALIAGTTFNNPRLQTVRRHGRLHDPGRSGDTWGTGSDCSVPGPLLPEGVKPNFVALLPSTPLAERQTTNLVENSSKALSSGGTALGGGCSLRSGSISCLPESSGMCQLPTSREPPLTTAVRPSQSSILGDGSYPLQSVREQARRGCPAATVKHSVDPLR